jgi:hypothetical protein
MTSAIRHRNNLAFDLTVCDDRVAKCRDRIWRATLRSSGVRKGRSQRVRQTLLVRRRFFGVVVGKTMGGQNAIHTQAATPLHCQSPAQEI